MQRTWAVVLAEGNFLGPNSDGVDSCLDAIQFDSVARAMEVSLRFIGSKVVESRAAEISYSSEQTRTNPNFREMWN
jgi:hypothetical protein